MAVRLSDVPSTDRKTTKTTKLDDVTERRIHLAMKALGLSAFADYNRRALIRECRETEAELRAKNPIEYKLIYGKEPYYNPPGA